MKLLFVLLFAVAGTSWFSGGTFTFAQSGEYPKSRNGQQGANQQNLGPGLDYQTDGQYYNQQPLGPGPGYPYNGPNPYPPYYSPGPNHFNNGQYPPNYQVVYITPPPVKRDPHMIFDTVNDIYKRGSGFTVNVWDCIVRGKCQADVL